MAEMKLAMVPTTKRAVRTMIPIGLDLFGIADPASRQPPKPVSRISVHALVEKPASYSTAKN
jgi:hypothetical protein